MVGRDIVPPQLVIEPARTRDLPEIMEVEREAWEEGVSTEAAASEDMMRYRIKLCNRNEPPWWFLVAKNSSRVEGYVLLQPTSVPPEKCVSWEESSDSGWMRKNFDARGPYIYGVSFAVRHGAHPMSADLMVLAGHCLRIAMNKPVFYLCARMPGFSRSNALSGVSAEDYWQECHEDGSPKDPLLHHFWNLIGVRPEKLLPNGYPPDQDSGGNGVLCVARDPWDDIVRTTMRLHRVAERNLNEGESGNSPGVKRREAQMA